MIESFDKAPNAAPMQLNTLTLERNAVLVARLPKDGCYDLSELHELRKALKEMFPCHSVLVWYDDVDFMTINDKGCAPQRLEGLNSESNYY